MDSSPPRYRPLVGFPSPTAPSPRASALTAVAARPPAPWPHDKDAVSPRQTRHSPRKAKLQRVAPFPFGAAAVRNETAAHFRRELFQFHQLLQDIATRRDLLSSQRVVSDRELLEALTSDRGDAVLREFFEQWRRMANGSHEDGEGLGAVLFEVLETLFSNLPLVVCESETAQNTKGFVRYVDALRSLRGVLTALLFKRETDLDDEDGTVSSSHRPRVPLFEYCKQLEREIQTLRRRVPAAFAMVDGSVKDEDVGLLHEPTELLLLEFWHLPRTERLSFLIQIASQSGEDDATLVLRAFVESSSSLNFLQLWDVLQGCPQFEGALLTASAAMQSRLRPTSQGIEAMQKDDRGEVARTPVEGESATERGRRAALRTPKRRPRAGARDSRYIDLNGIREGIDAFDIDEDERVSDSGSEDRDGSHRGELGMKRGGRRLQKLVVRERGRTPPTPNSGSRRRKHRHHQHTNKVDEEDERPSRDDHTSERKRTPLVRRDSGLPLFERLHYDLISLIKEEYGPGEERELLGTSAVMDAGWKLLEALEGHRKSGYHRRSAAMAAPAVAVEHSVSHSLENATGSNGRSLTPEQEFLIKMDQLQKLMASLSDTNVESLDTDVIMSLYRRLPMFVSLFNTLCGSVREAAGCAIPPPELGVVSPVMSPSKKRSVVSDHSHMLHSPPSWGADTSRVTVDTDATLDVDAVAELLGKVGKFVRSLAPVLELSDISMTDNALAIMKLADEMEISPPHEPTSSSIAAVATAAGRRGSTIEYNRRLDILRRLRILAKTSEFDSVATAIATTVNNVTQQRVTLITTAERESKAGSRGDGPRSPINEENDSDDDSGGEGAVDEMFRLAKSAKTRRMSAKAAAVAAAAAAAAASMAASADDEEDESSGRGGNPRDIPMNIRHGSASKGIKLFSVGILLRVIDQLYRDNFECTVTTLQYGNRRMEFSEFMYDWHIRKYGLKTLAQRHLLKLIQSLRKYEKKAFHCQLCLRFLGIQSPLGFHEHKFVLGLLDRWSLGTFSGSSKHRVQYSKQQFKVRVSYAVTTVAEALTERFGAYVRAPDAFAQRIRALALPNDDEFVKESDLLALAVDEWLAQRERIAQVLRAVYAAGDINGDGSLEYDEFAAAIFHLAPAIDDLFVQKIFTAAHDHVKPRRISFDRFLDVILLERVLNPNPPGAKPAATAAKASGSTASTAAAAGGDDRRGAGIAPPPGQSTIEEEEQYQFKLLHETWGSDRDSVMHVLHTSITHEPTASSLSFRVAFLDQLLAKRVDAKTAWLCHRQIMREIGRYQNLNAEEIVVLKTKEERFKKAVLAIRNMRQLGAQLQQLTASRQRSLVALETVSSPPPPPPGEDTHRPSYMAVVDRTLGNEEQAGGADVQVEALAAVENQLRLQFIEQADERSIDDFMNAMQRLRRASALAVPIEMTRRADEMATVAETADDVVRLQEEDEEDDSDGSEEDDAEPQITA